MATGTARLAGKRAFVTGGGSGIGRAVAQRFVEDGAQVAIMGRRAAALEETRSQLGAASDRCLVVPGDVSNEADVERCVGEAVSALGGLDVIVGVAGVEPAGSGDARVHEIEAPVWRETIDINLTGMFLTCKHGIRALLAGSGGSVIVTGSPCAVTGLCDAEHAYSASKAGTHGLVRAMATGYAADGIRVNCVIPGFIDTPINAGVVADPAAVAGLEARIPLGRAGRADETAGIFSWLASEEAGYVTGAFFAVDGGMTAA